MERSAHVYSGAGNRSYAGRVPGMAAFIKIISMKQLIPIRVLAVFSTGPAIRNTTFNLLSEIIGTFVLIFVVFYFTEAEIKDAKITHRVRLIRCSACCLFWFGLLVFHWAEPPVMLLTRPVIWVRALYMLCCPLNIKAEVTGNMHGCLLLVLSLVQ